MRANADLLVDARNASRSTWPNVEPARFQEACVRWAAAHGLRAVVVWDGAAPGGRVGTVELEGGAVAVGTGPESADDVIAREAAGRRDAGLPFRLVTSDRELRARAGDGAEEVVGGGAFLRRLGLARGG